MNIVQKFNEGGVFMYFILAFGLATMVLIVERGVALYFKIKSAPANYRQQILEFISKGDIRGAEQFARTVATDTALGKVAAIGCHLRANAGGDEEIQARMDEKLSEEISFIDRRTGFLAMFGNVSTLLGLLGTITGMIHSFAAVSSASPADRAAMLSRGISEAMNCTAFGLIVAIPALVAFAFYQNRTDRLVGELTESTSQIYHDLLFLTEAERSSSSASARSAKGSVNMNAPQPSMTV